MGEGLTSISGVERGRRDGRDTFIWLSRHHTEYGQERRGTGDEDASHRAAGAGGAAGRGVRHISASRAGCRRIAAGYSTTWHGRSAPSRRLPCRNSRPVKGYRASASTSPNTAILNNTQRKRRG